MKFHSTRVLLRIVFAIALLIPAAVLGADQKPIRIGWIGPLTGPAALLGVDSLEAVRMAIEEANARGGIAGRPIELVVEDDQLVVKNAVSSYGKLVHDQGIKIIMLYSYTGLFALAPRAQADGVLLIDPLDCDDDIAALPENVICVAKRTEVMGGILGEFIAQRGDSPAAIFYLGNDAFPLKAAAMVRAGMERHGGKVVVFESYAGGTTDFRPLLLQAKAKKVRAVVALSADEMGLILKQARDLGIKAQLYADAFAASPKVQEIAQGAAEDVIFPDWLAARTSEFEAFRRRFSGRTGRDPFIEISTVPSFDVANLLVRTLPLGVKSDGSIEMEKVRAGFYSIREYSGASGVITMGADGAVENLPCVMQQIKNGKSVRLP